MLMILKVLDILASLTTTSSPNNTAKGSSPINDLAHKTAGRDFYLPQKH